MSSDSESDDCANLPSGAECLQRCNNFAELTKTDNALAMFYLQDVNWDLQRALEAYYGNTDKNSSKVVACFDIEKLNAEERRYEEEEEEVEEEEEDVEEETSAQASSNHQANENKHLKIMSWNIDGLDDKSLTYRCSGIVRTLKKEKPDIVFLQEVVASSYEVLKDTLRNEYSIICGVDNLNTLIRLQPKFYFTLILIRNETCEQLDEKQIITFENSVMNRDLLKIKLRYKDCVNICAMNTHLESTVEFSTQRKEQLKLCFDEMLQEDKQYVVLFGGDLNLRDSELEAVGGIPEHIYDLWKITGARKECSYTWDCMRNNNLTMNGKFVPRCRFDRLYYRKATNNRDKSTVKPIYFELEGLEKLKNCSRFCSDHWAIQCYFDLVTA